MTNSIGKIIQITEEYIFIQSQDGRTINVKPSEMTYNNYYIGEDVTISKFNSNTVVSKYYPDNINSNNINVTVVPKPGTPVQKLPYALFALFLGGFGAHKFYAGKIGLGILYLVFCWTFIPSAIAFIEFIIALTKPEDENGYIYV